jgi:hypothetical protein
MAEYEVLGMMVSPIWEGRFKGGVKIGVICDGKPSYDINFTRETWAQLEERVHAALGEG